MKILAIVGSLRKESYNRQLAEVAARVVAEVEPSVEFEILEWSDVPLLNQDDEYPTPKAVVRVREQVKAADGLWIFTPEYNHSYPGTLKNLIDWLSRPVSEAEGQVLYGKPVAFCGASPGMSGTSHAQEHLIPLLNFLEMCIMSSPHLTVPHVALQTDETGRLTLESSYSYLQRQAEALTDFISGSVQE